MPAQERLIATATQAGQALVARLGFLGPLLARLSVGSVFILTGWGKLHSLDTVTEYFTSLGIPMPGLNAAMAAGTEFVCGALLVAGLASRLAALPLVVVMTVAIATAKRDELNAITDLLGFEEFTYIAIFLWIAAAGPGLASLDHLILRWWQRRPALVEVAANTVRA